MKTLRAELRPTWASGVELCQTTLNCVQVVGDIPHPVALQGVGANALAWLEQLDGDRSWDAQIAEADARGVDPFHAREILQRLFTGGLLVDSHAYPIAPLFAKPAVVGAGPIVDHLLGLIPGANRASPIPKPRDGTQWRVTAERIVDDLDQSPTIVVLDGPWVDAAEYELVARLVDRQISHVLVGAGANTARVGPITIAGRGPCTRCDEKLKLDLDPSWRQLAAHLALDGKPTHSNSLGLLAAAELARQIVNNSSGSEAAAHNAVLTSGYFGGPWTRRILARHAQCSCWWSSVHE